MKYLILSAGVLLTGWAATHSGDDTILISDVASSYMIGRLTVIDLEVTNQTTESVYYNSCQPVALEQVENGQVQDRWSGAACRCHCYREVKPGASTLFRYSLGTVHGQGRWLDPGTYRLALPSFYDGPYPHHHIRFRGLFSDDFELRMP